MRFIIKKTTHYLTLLHLGTIIFQQNIIYPMMLLSKLITKKNLYHLLKQNMMIFTILKLSLSYLNAIYYLKN